LETTLIQVTRTLFAMAAPHPPGRARHDPQALADAVAGRARRGGHQPGPLRAIDQARRLLVDHDRRDHAIGLQICIYYALAGIAVVVAYRKVAFKSIKGAILVGIWPGAGALFMLFLLVQSCFGPNRLTGAQIGIGIGAVAIGIVPIAYYWARGTRWFRDPGSKLVAEEAI